MVGSENPPYALSQMDSRTEWYCCTVGGTPSILGKSSLALQPCLHTIDCGMRITENSARKWMLGVGVATALLAVPGFFVALSILRTDTEFGDQTLPLPPPWLPGSVEERIARRVADVADAMGCPPSTVLLIEASITVVDTNSQTGNLPLAKARALIELTNDTEFSTLTVLDNGQGATAEEARSQALGRLLTKVTELLKTQMDC